MTPEQIALRFFPDFPDDVNTHGQRFYNGQKRRELTLTIDNILRFQQKRIEELEEALRPMVDVAQWFDVAGVANDETFIKAYSAVQKKHIALTLGHCRRAAALLAKKEGKA